MLILLIIFIEGCCTLGGPVKVYDVSYGSLSTVVDFSDGAVYIYYFNGKKDGYSFSDSIWLEGDLVGVKISGENKISSWKVHYHYPYLGSRRCIFSGLIKIQNSVDVFVRCSNDNSIDHDFDGKLLLLTYDGMLKEFCSGNMRNYSYAISTEFQGKYFYFLSFYNKVANEWEYEHRLLPYMKMVTGGIFSRSLIIDQDGRQYSIKCRSKFCKTIYDASTWLKDEKFVFQTTTGKLGIGKLVFDGDSFYVTDVTFTDAKAKNGFYSVFSANRTNTGDLILYTREISFPTEIRWKYYIHNFAEIRREENLSLVNRVALSSGWWSEGYLDSQDEILSMLKLSYQKNSISFELPSYLSMYNAVSKTLFTGYYHSLFVFSIPTSSVTAIDLARLTGRGFEFSITNSAIYGNNNIWIVNWFLGGECQRIKDICHGNSRTIYEACKSSHKVYQIKNWQDPEVRKLVRVFSF